MDDQRPDATEDEDVEEDLIINTSDNDEEHSREFHVSAYCSRCVTISFMASPV